MNAWISIVTLLAQTTPGGSGGGGGAPQQAPPAGMTFIFALLPAMLVFIFLSQRSRDKKRDRERKALFDSLSKNDRVLTVGGVIGTVHAVKGHEVVLKVDESTNTKMVFVKSAIQRVIHDDSDAELETK